MRSTTGPTAKQGMRELALLPWLAVCLLVVGADADAQGLPDALTGRVQVYDGVTFDLVQDGGRYRTLTRIRLESVNACQIRQKATLHGVDWPCGVVAAAWLVSQTLSRDIECRPTRSLRGGGYSAQCYVEDQDIGAAGLRDGMYIVSVPPNEVALARYNEIERAAKGAGVGLWSSEFMMPNEWRRAHGTYNPIEPHR